MNVNDTSPSEDDPRIQVALKDLREGIAGHYPEATFDVERGFDPEGTYLVATVDVEDSLEVLDVIMDRLLEIQIDEYLPVHVVIIRPPGQASQRQIASHRVITEG